jgi:SAM-dependent methyltransferase
VTTQRPLTADERQQVLAQYRAERASASAPEMLLVQALRANWPPTIEAMAADEFAAELLVSAPIYPLPLERALTGVRRRLLLGGADESLLPFLARLAIQGHLNEYAWLAGDDEIARVRDLAARAGELGPIELMLLAAYRPLASLPQAAILPGRFWEEPVAGVLKEQVEAPLRERAIAGRIPVLTAIRPGVSEAVRGQYEAHPYPRWRALAPAAPVQALYGVSVPEKPEVLIAGCGTGFQAIVAAQRFPTGQVTAVDLSLASLAYGQRLAQDIGQSNIAFFQADILEMGASDARFDIVESTGVLHHMADPFEGARAVSTLLKPGGLIKIGLYSALARARLGPAKALARTFTPETIPQMRMAIAAAPPDDPVREAERFLDFYATSPCRDLLMHVQEHEMGFGDLRRMLGENGLEFLGFSIDPAPLAAYRKFAPHDANATDLDAWEAFERLNPQLFLNMYQFWARKTV